MDNNPRVRTIKNVMGSKGLILSEEDQKPLECTYFEDK